MPDDLRQRYADALSRSMTPQTGWADHLDAVMVVRDEEMEALRRQRDEAEAAIARARYLAAEWATLPHGTYTRAGRRILAALDTPEEST